MLSHRSIHAHHLLALSGGLALLSSCSAEGVRRLAENGPGASMPAGTAGNGTAGADPGTGADPGGPPDAGVSGGTDAAAGAATGLPCDVQGLVASHCAMCHSDPPKFGAPMSLASYADFQKPAVSDPGKKVYQMVASRIADPDRPMPPTSQTPLTSAERATLTMWLSNGAPGPNTTACTGAPAMAQVPPVAVPDPEDCDTRAEFKAFGATKDTKYQVPQVDDIYTCFYFKAPWDADVQGVAIRAITDDARVLHHWILYAEDNANYKDGTSEGCNGQHPNAYMVAGWAPGGVDKIMPPEAGLRLPKGPNGFFILEAHYHNTPKYADALDASGVKVCATTKPRKYMAGVHWLGTELIALVPFLSSQTVTGKCRPNITEPVHVLMSTPHMHKLGRHMKTVIHRANGGGDETLLDKNFAFEDQTTYMTPTTLNAGDTLDTSCTYHNDTNHLVTFGETTADEMCFNFMIAYPDGILNTGGLLLKGPDRCLR